MTGLFSLTPKRQKKLQKFFSAVAIFSLFLQIGSGIFYFKPVLAEDEVTPTPTEQVTPTPEPPVEPTPTLEATPTPTLEVTPTIEPTPTVDPTPEISPEATPTPIPTEEITPTPTIENSQPNQENQAPPNETSPPAPSSNDTSSATPSENTPTPTVTVEQPVEKGQIDAVILKDVKADSIDLDLVSENVEGSATLVTDKADYAPTDTALITGNGFNPNETYTLIISSTDEPPVNFETQVTAYENGAFVYAYQLDGNYRPNYKVEAKDKDGKILATIIFTDTANFITQILSWDTIGLDSNNVNTGPHQFVVQARITNNTGTTQNSLSSVFTLGSGTGSPYISTVGPTTQSLGNLANNSSVDVFFQVLIAANSSAYNTALPYTVTTTSSNPASTSASGTFLVEHLVSQNRNQIVSTVISPSTIHIGDTFTVTVNSHSSSTFDNISVPMSYSPTVARLMSDLTTYSSPAGTESDFYALNEGHNITSVFTFKALAAGSANFFWLIYDKSGSSFHYNNDFGSAIVISVQPQFSITKTPATQTVNAGADTSYTVTVNNTGNGSGVISSIVDTLPTGFSYVNGSTTGTTTTSNPDIVGQVLTWNGPWTVNPGNSIALTFHATATSTPGTYTNSVISKDDGNNTIGPATSQIIVQQITGTLKVIKSVVSANGGNASASAFTLHVKSGGSDVAGSPAAGSATGTTYTLNAGSYVVSENSPSTLGYSQTGFSGDCDSNGNVTVVVGQLKTCTITNNDIQPQLTVTKVVNNTHGGTKVVSDFPLFVDLTSVTSGVQNGFNNGTYTVSETNQTGYSGVISGDCLANGSITLNSGDVKSCTITNNDQPATLIVKKVVVNDNGGTLEADDFSFSVNSGTTVPFEADGQNDLTVNAGTYSVTEPAVSGYSTSYDNCSGVVIANGGSATCTITNNDQQVYIIVNKTVKNDNGGSAVADDFKLTVDGNSVLDEVAYAVNPGTHTAGETNLSGYTQGTWGGDCDGQASVTVALGETKICTITNDDIQPLLTVTKVVNGGDKQVGDFPLFVDQTQVNSDIEAGFDAGTYTVSETNQTGYTSAITGDCASDGTITLAIGDIKSCTITNTRDMGDITILKNVDTDGDGNVDVYGATDWAWDVTNGEQNIATGQLRTLPTGLYTITEDLKTDYELVGWSCGRESEVSGTTNSIPIELTTDDITCTFTNKYIPSDIGLTLDKTHDKMGLTASRGDILNFTLTVSNTGKGTAYNVTVQDSLPDGFSYVAGSSKVEGVASEPTPDGNKLTWNIGEITGGSSKTITYQVKISDSIAEGSHANVAVAFGFNRKEDKVYSNFDYVYTAVGIGISYSVSVGGAVLGAATGQVLGAATGSPTILLIMAILMILAGLAILLKKGKKFHV